MSEIGTEIVRVEIDGVMWTVVLGENDAGAIGVKAHKVSTPEPEEPNVYWDTQSRHIDEAPPELPGRVRAAIHRWMRERY